MLGVIGAIPKSSRALGTTKVGLAIGSSKFVEPVTGKEKRFV